MRKAVIIILSLCFAKTLFAQQAADSSLHTAAVVKDTLKKTTTETLKSDVPSLSDTEYNAWLKGSELKTDLTLVAEINNYPTPEKVLKLKKQLDLSPIQINQLNDIVKYLRLKKVEAGGDFVRNEKMLDSLFRTKKANESNIIFFGNRYGLFLGEYRTSLLIACKRTSDVLTSKQLSRYVQLQNRN
jgi:hypothetical protein